MRRINRSEFSALLARGSLVVGTREKPWLLRTEDGDAIKFLYRRKRISSAILRPAAGRFAANGDKLAQRGVAAPKTSEILFYPDLPAHLVRYPWLEGEDLRTLCDRNQEAILLDLAEYLALLHGRGIYFRALHLGNVLRLADGGFALVDITDLRCTRRALTAFERARNVAHLLATREDEERFSRFGVTRFLDAYRSATGLAGSAVRRFDWRLRVALPQPDSPG